MDYKTVVLYVDGSSRHMNHATYTDVENHVVGVLRHAMSNSVKSKVLSINVYDLTKD